MLRCGRGASVSSFPSRPLVRLSGSRGRISTVAGGGGDAPPPGGGDFPWPRRGGHAVVVDGDDDDDGEADEDDDAIPQGDLDTLRPRR